MTSHWLILFPVALLGLTIVGLEVTVALAAVAVLGYLFSQRTRKVVLALLDSRRQRELERAARIAWQLESIADTLRHDLASHHAIIGDFKRKLRTAQEEGDELAWERLCAEAESMLVPTMQLAHQLSYAYDQIRQQSEALETFTQGRTDPLTGVGNGRALDQHLQVLLGAAARGRTDFAVAMVSLDRQPGAADQPWTTVMPLLPRLAGVVRSCMRETDFVARYGDEEFVVVMPQTSLVGASLFGDRLRRHVSDELGGTVSCGIAEVQANDDSKSLLARADSALYSAKAAGTNRVFIHSGANIREHVASVAVAAAEAQPADAAAVPTAIDSVDHDDAEPTEQLVAAGT